MTHNRFKGFQSVPAGWNLNEKIKTCKCETCGNKVRKWSLQCENCKKHMCSECLEPVSKGTPTEEIPWGQMCAQDRLKGGCWCKRFRSNMNPALARYKPEVQRRAAEEMQDLVSKGLASSSKLQSNAQSNRSAGSSRRILPSPARDAAPEQPYDDYNEQGPSVPTIAKTRPHRSSTKRKTYEDESDDQAGTEDTTYKPKKQMLDTPLTQGEYRGLPANGPDVNQIQNVAHLRGTTTVIVGAGVVGLFIARELAQEAKQTGIEHRIVVVELRSSYCELASGHSAGFLTTSGLSEAWNPLVQEARKWWLEEVSSSDIRERLRFNANTTVQLEDGGARNQAGVPSWLREGWRYSLLEDANGIGRIEPASLAAWLFEECTKLDVRFYFDHSLSNIEIGANSTVSSVSIQFEKTQPAPVDPAWVNTAPVSPPPVELICSNLVFAAGPFTSGIFRKHFSNTPLQLENHVQGSDWFHVSTSIAGNSGNTALRFPSAAKHESRLSDEIMIVSDIHTSNIVVSGTTSRIDNKDLKVIYVKKPGLGKTRELKNIAAYYLNTDRVNIGDDIKYVRRGRSELSVANEMAPIIDGVPPSGIGFAIQNESEHKHPCSVWLCYGFGRYGTMLAPGAAKLLVSKMLGRSLRSGIEAQDDNFRIPEYIKPQAKGKGKARVLY